MKYSDVKYIIVCIFFFLFCVLAIDNSWMVHYCDIYSGFFSYTILSIYFGKLVNILYILSCFLKIVLKNTNMLKRGIGRDTTGEKIQLIIYRDWYIIWPVKFRDRIDNGVLKILLQFLQKNIHFNSTNLFIKHLKKTQGLIICSLLFLLGA